MVQPVVLESENAQNDSRFTAMAKGAGGRGHDFIDKGVKLSLY